MTDAPGWAASCSLFSPVLEQEEVLRESIGRSLDSLGGLEDSGGQGSDSSTSTVQSCPVWASDSLAPSLSSRQAGSINLEWRGFVSSSVSQPQHC